MISRRTHTASQTVPWRTRLDSVTRCWPWLLLALAALVFTARYVPSYFRSAVDTETTMLAVFYHDTMEEHHPFSTWGWGGCSDLFPDVSVTFLLNFLCRDGWLALELLAVFYFVSWLAASAGLAIVLKRPNKLSLFSILLLFWVGQICNFSLPFDWGLHLLNPLFAPMYHSGTGLLCLVCLVLLLDQISGGRSGWRSVGFWCLFVLVFLGGTSDILFLIDFVVPSLLTLGLLAIAFRQNWKNDLWLGLNLTLASVASYFLGPYCFPVQTATRQFLHLDFNAACATFSVVLGEMSRPEHHFFAFMGVLDVLTVLGGVAGLLFFCFSSRRKLVSPFVFSLMAFCSSAIFLDWFTTLLTGLYGGMYTNRYLAVALIIPMFLIAFALHAVILWRPWLEKLFAAMTAVFTICVAFIPQDPHPDYLSMEAEIPFLKTLVKERHIQAGLADYWRANLCTFLSHWEVPLRPATGDGNIYRWFCSLEWFGKGHPFKEWPHFRMIYAPDHRFGETFGPPDEIVYTPALHTEIWIYSEARSIVYNEYFDVLSNKFLDDGRTLRINPSTLPSDTGTIQGTSRIAVAGHDGDGFLNGGPYISLKPAHYRLTFHYAYLLPPAPDKFPTCDLVVHSVVQDQELLCTPLPYLGAGPQTFSHDFTVSKPNQNFEMRIFYHSSGTLRFDFLDVTCLGP